MSKKILVIDNYDSFVYNLVHYLEDLDCEVVVKRNDRLSLTEVEGFEKILLSPGPGIPDEAGLLKEIIKTYAGSKSIFGVCLGQQAIGEVFGGSLTNLNEVYHGVATQVTLTVTDELLFQGLESNFEVGRYHSWVVSDQDLPDCLEVLAVTEEEEIMGLRHKEYPIVGVQFHPESILTEYGRELLQNFLDGK